MRIFSSSWSIEKEAPVEECRATNIRASFSLPRSYTSDDYSDHKSEGFLKSLWHNITHPHGDGGKGDGSSGNNDKNKKE